MESIEDFNKNELWVVGETLMQRYGRQVEPDQVETELRLNSFSTELTPCPALFWKDGSCNFVVVKVGLGRYRAQFFYRVHQQFGTGIEEYGDLSECIVTLLQVQSEHEAKEMAKE